MRDYFKGWYFKCQSETQILAVIRRYPLGRGAFYRYNRDSVLEGKRISFCHVSGSESSAKREGDSFDKAREYEYEWRK